MPETWSGVPRLPPSACWVDLANLLKERLGKGTLNSPFCLQCSEVQALALAVRSRTGTWSVRDEDHRPVGCCLSDLS